MTANKYWREAASIIALTRSNINNSNKISNGFKILFEKRSDKSGFMPSNIVFPGGVTDKSDFDNMWIQFIKTFNIPDDRFSQFQKPNTDVPLLFQHDSDPNLKHLGLRITAIRETFEETGLLICRSRNDPSNDHSTASFQSKFDVAEWQEKVNKDPLKFFALCEHFDCYPDVWSLHLWSNWLTPTTKPRRYNTAFFITFLDTQPDIHIHEKEVTEYMWSPPNNVLESFKEKNLILATPQWYELSKLNNLQDFNELRKYSAARSGHGCDLMFPIYQKAKDATIVTFPGDALYPKIPDLVNNHKLSLEDTTCDELRISSDTIHRMVYKNPHSIKCEITNYFPKYHEITPASTSFPSISN